ncbi:hypothetical protein OG871_08850 [Kitasatospora sp. NBC_00374]|uniref:hypothetical protein n=1 Tax=Kitasatospora sp. NBC_00374 TaxID=2975964 RepID=UPI003253D7D3
MQIKKAAFALTLAAAALVGAGSTPASAHAVTPNGNVYVYDRAEQNGAYCATGNNVYDYRYFPGCGDFNDRTSSAWNNGYADSMPAVKFYTAMAYGGNFVVCLMDGDSVDYLGYDNQISSHRWASGC